MAIITWNGATGNWTDASDWSTDSVPGASDTAVIQSGEISITAAIDVGAINISSGEVAVAIDAPGVTDDVFGSFTVDSGSVSLNSAGGASSATTLNVGGNFFNHSLYGLNIDNVAGQGGSVLDVTGTLVNSSDIDIGSVGNSLVASTNATVGHLENTGSISLYGGAGSYSANSASLIDTGDSAPTVLQYQTISLSGNALLQYARGQIQYIGDDGALTLNGASANVADGGGPQNGALSAILDNNGALSLQDGASLAIDSSSLLNAGTLTATDASLSTESVVNLGTINLNYDGLASNSSGSGGGGQLTINGSLSNYGLIWFERHAAGTSLTVTGTLDNAGSFQFENDAAATTVTLGGLINAGGLFLDGAFGAGAALQQIDVNAAAPSSLVLGSSLFVQGDAELQFASGEITSVSEGADLEIEGNQARVSDKSGSTTNSAISQLANNAGTILLTDDALMTNSKVAFTNSGTYTIEDGTTVKTSSGVNFTNSGTLNVSDEFFLSTTGGTLTVGGTLTNSGVLNVGIFDGGTGTVTVTAHSLVNSGTINIGAYENGNPASLIASNTVAPAELQYGVSLNLAGNALLEFKSGSIKTIDSGAELSLSGAQANIETKGSTSVNNVLTHLSDNAGILSLSSGAILPLASGEKFTNGGTLELNTEGTADTSYSLDLTGTLVNSGTISLGGQSYAATTLTVAHLDNTGAIDLQTPLGSSFQSAFEDSGDDAPSSISAGVSFNLSGNALLEFAGGDITSIASGGELSLVGKNAFVAISSAIAGNSALNGLDSNAGTLSLADGASFTSGASTFDNGGQLDLDTGANEGGTTFNVTGTLTNSGAINIGSSSQALTGATTLVATHLVNTGTISIASIQSSYAATVQDTEDAAPSTLSSGMAINVSGDASIQFASGSVQSIAANAGVSVIGSNASIGVIGNSTANAALAELSNNAGTFTLDDGAVVNNGSNNLSNSGILNVDADVYSYAGITNLTIGGLLTNTGTLSLKTSLYATGADVSAGSASNSGLIQVEQSGSGAGVGVSGTFTNTGTIDLTGDAEVQAEGIFYQQSGAINLNGYFSSVSGSSVDISAGSIGGYGRIVGNVVMTGGTVFGGTATTAETVMISGNLTTNSGSTLGVTLIGSAPNEPEDIAVNGRLDISGGTLQISIPDPQDLAVGESFDAIYYEQLQGAFTALQYGSTTGSATSVNIGGGLALELSYTANYAVLTVAKSGVHGETSAHHVASSASLADVAAADGFDFAQTVMSTLENVTSVTRAPNAALFALSFEELQLNSHHALMYTAPSGAHAGTTYLVIDPNGVTGYHTGETMIVALSSQEASAFSHLG